MSSEPLKSVFLGDLTRDQRAAAYVALTAKGKIKGKDLETGAALRNAILEPCEIENDKVTWANNEPFTLRSFDDLKWLARAVDKLVDDDGVDVSLAEGALTLRELLSTKVAELASETARVKKLASETAAVKKIEASQEA
jgi:hypothetical protein